MSALVSELLEQLVGPSPDDASACRCSKSSTSTSYEAATPISPEQARQRLRTLARWPTHAPLPSDVLDAAELAEQHQLSFWDAMILRSASQLDCATLWTEDLNPGQRVAGVEIANPFAGTTSG